MHWRKHWIHALYHPSYFIFQLRPRCKTSPIHVDHGTTTCAIKPAKNLLRRGPHERGKSSDRIQRCYAAFNSRMVSWSFRTKFRAQANESEAVALSLELANRDGDKDFSAVKKHYYFDYNTLDRVWFLVQFSFVLLAWCLSKQFYITDLEAGFEKLNPSSTAFYNTVLICAGLVLLVPYFTTRSCSLLK